MEDIVKDAIITGDTDDRVLDLLIDIVVSSIQDGRPLFPNVMTEPSFYRRYFRRWVAEALAELASMRGSED